MRVNVTATEPGWFVRAVSVVEKKNNHLSTRIIPDSLGYLISMTGTKYPMTEKRFM